MSGGNAQVILTVYTTTKVIIGKTIRNLGKSTRCRFQQTEIPTDARTVVRHRWSYLLSQNICRNFRLSDNLVQFWYRASNNVLPCNYTLSLWDANKNPTCSLDGYHLENMSHVLNGCRQFSKNYSKRQDRVVEKLAEELTTSCTEIYVNKLFSTTFPEFKEDQYAASLKPDIVIKTGNNILIIDVACPYDLYTETLINTKSTTASA